MSLPLFPDGLDLSPVLGSHPSGTSERIVFGACRGLADSGHVRPLLDLLGEVVKVQGFVVVSMPQLHSRPSTGEAWVRAPDQVAPLGRGFGKLASRARITPRVCSGETGVRNTGECGAGLENVGVGAEQHVGHHGTRTDAGGEDTGGVGRVSGDGVSYHVSDREGVAAAIVGESGGRVYIPAATRHDGVWIAASITRVSFPCSLKQHYLIHT